jgi:hypothetical protein
MNQFIQHTGIYSTCWILFYVLSGILMYIWDRQYLSGIYKLVYDVFHGQPLDKPRSFIFGQSTARKVAIATFISTVQSVGLFFFTGFHSNPFVELVLWFLEIPAMVTGFALGYLLFPAWEKRKQLYAKLDEYGDKVDKVADTFHHRHDQSPAQPVPQAITTVASPVPVAAEQEMRPAPEERIKKFTGKE